LADQIMHYLVLSGGLLAVMPLLLVLTLAVGIERWWLLNRTLRAGARLQSALCHAGYRDLAALRVMAREHPKTLQAHLVPLHSGFDRLRPSEP